MKADSWREVFPFTSVCGSSSSSEVCFIKWELCDVV